MLWLKLPPLSQFYIMCVLCHLSVQSQAFHCLPPEKTQSVCSADSFSLEGRNSFAGLEQLTGSHHPVRG